MVLTSRTEPPLQRGLFGFDKSETGFLVLNKQSGIACRYFLAARDLFLCEKSDFFAWITANS